MLSETLLFASLTLAAPSDLDKGRFLFHDPGLGQNGVACADCHTLVEDEKKDGDGRIRAGHTLFDVGRRPYWRGDHRRQFNRNLSDALEVCVSLFMGGPSLDPRPRALLTKYLESLRGRARVSALRLETALEADLNYNRPKYQGGDPDRGRALFYRACHSCHPHGRAGIAPKMVKTSVAEVAMKIREGNGLLRGSRKPGEWMPAYGPDRLSHQEVADIAAYVAVLRAKK